MHKPPLPLLFLAPEPASSGNVTRTDCAARSCPPGRCSLAAVSVTKTVRPADVKPAPRRQAPTSTVKESVRAGSGAASSAESTSGNSFAPSSEKTPLDDSSVSVEDRPVYSPAQLNSRLMPSPPIVTP